MHKTCSEFLNSLVGIFVQSTCVVDIKFIPVYIANKFYAVVIYTDEEFIHLQQKT